ncbi:tRNA glutamyl-Q synthetase [Mucilaginibacter limnophilus]|uniref:tRNA glutamyl-Q synthetase n=1 Tax=Mucilaginibacter limnophilus TaxID=1932778 RepID=A0A437MHZ6_9SPHI|nr:glutamate--tRNA ligase family protein [Mucilaginibacter limnophilus]RVT97287.1 tRNA glutamyl-Q synthetase [Mucilaginibacter limnophilus]
MYNKTRIAPTPSGYLHIGNILSFAITAALARRNGAKILLRIDDMDRARADKRYVDDIFETLNFLDIPWDEGPRNADDFESNWSQTRRLDLYNEALQQLWDTGKVFACTCSRAQIEAAGTNGVYPGTCRNKRLPPDTPSAAWRLETSASDEIVVKTLSGVIKTILPEDMHDFIVRKKDGYPAYQLTSVIDDLYFGINLIVRGQDLWASTLAQHYLASALNRSEFSPITFYHHPLITQADGQKLSKSAGATSVKYLREEGKSPADIYAEIAGMLGASRPVSHWNELIKLVNELR